MDLKLSGRVVVLAGAGLGIGRETAALLAEEGCHLILGSRSKADLAETTRRVEGAGARARSIVADISVAEDAQRLVAAAVSEFGVVHGVVLAVGATPLGRFEDLTLPDWEVALRSKFLPVVQVLAAALPHLRRAMPGRVVIVTGNTATLPSSMLVTSAVVNSALAALAASMARSLGPARIGVNCVSPGPTETRRAHSLVAAVAAAKGISNDDSKGMLLESIADGRFGRADEVAGAIAYLLSPIAEHVNGTSLTVDGAQAWQP